jgi:hypothetical protein
LRGDFGQNLGRGRRHLARGPLARGHRRPRQGVRQAPRPGRVQPRVR